MNKLCVCGVAVACAILWAGGLAVVGLVNRFHPDYGTWYLQLVGSLYPGYHAMTGLKNLLVGVLYALVDGAVCGALFGLVYNFIVARCCCGKKGEEKTADKAPCCS
jgi:hypothetical protein